MKLYPTNFLDLFDDVFPGNEFRTTPAIKTDILEKDGNYILDMEMPGYKKEDISVELKRGYLTISASRNTNKEEKDKKGNVIRQERFSGTVSRQFYVGDGVTEEDIKASYDNGELKITFPSKKEELPEKKTICIE